MKIDGKYEEDELNETAQDKQIVLKKSHIYSVIGAVVMLSVFIFAANAMIANAGNSAVASQIGVTGNAVGSGTIAQIQDGKQVVKVTMQGSSYMPNPIRVKIGIPVELDVDTSSVEGCYRGIQIPAFGIRKTVSDADNKIEFTPNKAGTFPFACFMNMGHGTIMVEDASGNVQAAASAAAPSVQASGSCGSSGGCGCGGVSA